MTTDMETTDSTEENPTTPPVIEDEPQLETPPPPPPPPLPPAPLTFEPATYYAITSVCVTADTGDGTPCPNLNTTTTEPMIYSNAGAITMICGPCGKKRTILEAVKLDPQPEVS